MKETDCRKCCVCAFKEDLCNGDFCEKYYREGNAEDFEKLLPHWIPFERHDAIIQLSHNKNGDDDCDVIVQKDIETIKQLPSAQPEVKPIDYRDCANAMLKMWMDNVCDRW